MLKRLVLMFRPDLSTPLKDIIERKTRPREAENDGNRDYKTDHRINEVVLAVVVSR